MFGCQYGARYLFNSWTGGSIDNEWYGFKGAHECDQTPWNDFAKNPDGHMTFFDMYPLAEGRWFKFTPAFFSDSTAPFFFSGEILMASKLGIPGCIYMSVDITTINGKIVSEVPTHYYDHLSCRNPYGHPLNPAGA